MQKTQFFDRVKLYLFALLLLTLFFAQTASAQVKSFYWEEFDVNMTLLPNGDVNVVEAQTLVFSGGTFTFGFRTIPVGVEGQNDGIIVHGVREGDIVYEESSLRRDNTYIVSQQSGETVIDWYFAPTDGRHTYTLEYTVQNPIIVGTAEEGDGDQLFWKPLPPDLLGSRVENSRVTLNLPNGVQPQQYLDGSGYLAEGNIDGNSTLVETRVSEDGETVVFEAQTPIFSGDVFEIRTQIPHGVLAIPVPEWQQRQMRNDSVQLVVLLLAVALLCLGPLGVIALWYMLGRDPELSVTPPDYVSEPPSNLPPAVVGSLIDERADMHDVISTLVDLARRGFLTIEEKKGNDFVFTRSEGSGSLRPFEQTFYQRLFRGNKNSTELSSLRYKFHTTVPKIQRQLYDELVDSGFFPAPPESIRNRFSVLAGLVLAAAAVSAFIIAAVLPEDIAIVAACPGIALGLSGAMLLYVARHMPRKTQKGVEEAAKWMAFKKYLEKIEQYEKIEQATELFEKYLPYATAFGIERAWIRKFSQMAQTPPPTWYYPYPGHYGGYGRPFPSGSGGSSSGERGGSREGGRPTLEGMSGGLTGGLAAMSGGLTRMLNSSSRVMQTAPPSQSSSGGFSGGFSGGGSFSSGGGGSGGFG